MHRKKTDTVDTYDTIPNQLIRSSAFWPFDKVALPTYTLMPSQNETLELVIW